MTGWQLPTKLLAGPVLDVHVTTTKLHVCNGDECTFL